MHPPPRSPPSSPPRVRRLRRSSLLSAPASRRRPRSSQLGAGWVTALLIALSIAAASANRGYAYLDPELEDLIDDFIGTTLECREIAGMNLAIVKGNRTLITKGYGVADFETSSFVDEKTLFGVASLTKAFASTLLGVLLEESPSYTWDSTIKEILGDDFYFHDILRTEKMTLRDLLTHRTGIPPNNYARLQGLTREQLAEKLRFFEATEDFKGSYLYNNIMYGLISHISEVIGGHSWEDLMTKKIFEPLGMTSTTFTHTTNLSRIDMAVPYLPYNGSTWRQVSWKLHSDWGELGGSGSVMSNSLDMAAWLKMQLNRGVSAEGCRVVPKSVVEATHEPANVISESSYERQYRRPHAPVSYTFHQYAMGWRTGSYRGLPTVTHTGTSWGYGALLTLVPDYDLGIYTSITGPDTGYKGRRNIHMYIMDLLLNMEPWLNLTTACTFPDESVRRYMGFRINVDPVLPLAKYTGTFGNFGYGNVSIYLPPGSERLMMRYGELGLWELYPTLVPHKFIADGREDTWSMDLANMWFETNAAGDEVDKLVIASFETRFPPIFLRGLRMSDAPPPPELCPKAEAVVSESVEEQERQPDSIASPVTYVNLGGRQRSSLGVVLTLLMLSRVWL